ncbi:hypothetical protein A1O1_05181 [Capronia coronata CBS 617.96]|uniref:BAH domain-containing protein n=1 Tax=Capronia coronata CBS 617.96 TaxID=1182541 RepID=W9YG56_9EURO|nr:uncharacterized protein A1O1_05181 [Capronia coronata CBS 617.96]EXJ88251.1 hypothetical protein A1O1_05181 [Capronia coronata CBS 617.96]
MPLTPGDSDNEEPSEPGQMAGRKRSASEMEDDASRSKITDMGFDTDTDAETSGAAGANGTSAANGTDGADGSETIEAELGDEFTVECPARPKRGKAAATDSVYVERDSPSLAPHLSIEFAVRPGQKWAGLSRFRNAKFKNPMTVIYSAGQVVYINRHSPIPPPPPADASDDEKLQYDKENFWVGLIAEFRAESHAKVFARVFWFYWPEELPMGRQPYHGKHELILSNYTDIIEAHSIASHAEMSTWDENDDSNQLMLLERYWRQTLDVTKLRPNPAKAANALSKLRKYCICGGYDNPNVDMYQCRTVGCGMWNHEECLVKDLEERAWEQLKQGSLTHEVQDKQHEKGFTQKMGETLGHIVNLGLGRGEVKDEARSDAIPVSRGAKKLKLATGGKTPWSGKLQGKIVKAQDDTHAAIVTQLVPNANSKAARQFEPKVWHMKMSCLKCRQPLN